MTTNSD